MKNKYFLTYMLPTKSGKFKTSNKPNEVMTNTPVEIVRHFVTASSKNSFPYREYRRITAEMKAKGIIDEILKGRFLVKSEDCTKKQAGMICISNEKQQMTYYMVW